MPGLIFELSGHVLTNLCSGLIRTERGYGRALPLQRPVTCACTACQLKRSVLNI